MSGMLHREAVRSVLEDVLEDLPNPRTAADIIAEEFLLICPVPFVSRNEIYLAAERAEIALRAVNALHDPVGLCEDPDHITDAEARAAADILIRKGWITIS